MFFNLTDIVFTQGLKINSKDLLNLKYFFLPHLIKNNKKNNLSFFYSLSFLYLKIILNKIFDFRNLLFKNKNSSLFLIYFQFFSNYYLKSFFYEKFSIFNLRLFFSNFFFKFVFRNPKKRLKHRSKLFFYIFRNFY